MAAPNQEQGKPERNVRPPTEQVSEEMVMVRLLEEMMKKVDEIYTVALGLESTDELAKLLGEVGIVRVTLTQMVGKLKEAEEMQKAQAALMAEREEEKK